MEFSLKNLKRFLLPLLLLPLLALPTNGLEARSKKAQRYQADQVEQTVYVTKTGHKFHRAGCRYLRHSSRAVSREEAERWGLEPCKVCRP